MPKITTRQANIEDFKKVFNLLKELWPNYDLDIKVVKHIFSEGLASDQIYYFVAQKNNEIIGFVSLSITNSLQYGKIATIDEVIVTKKYRRQGVGKNMLNCVESFAKKIHCKNIDLHSGLLRKKAHIFYKSNGFEIVSHYFFKNI